MTVNIVYPKNGHTAYKIAAETFLELLGKSCGLVGVLKTDYDPLPEDDSPIVIIGTDAVNHMAALWYLERKIDDFGLRYGQDNYRIYTKNIDGHPCLFLGGGRPRSTIYAVYRYFEKYCGCRWFWDGDRIAKAEFTITDIDITEAPRFEYRGLRYFAHRSLHRFQAEHWNLEDWQKEIDWILKKRLNLFMLRIGLDDLFQKAFPDVVPYPKLGEPLPEAGKSYDDRNLFWSLEFRGELRKKLLAYAFERDLMHPEDCGTVTHWYSRTPKAYLEKVNPPLLYGEKYGGEPTGQTWDVLNDQNLENYFKLTETHIKEYGKAEIFHTIGLAERSFSEDKEVNMRLKLYVYRRICSYLKEKYPSAPLLIASWDLWGWFENEEVQRLLAELDPNQAIILDYTSDTVRDCNFSKWGVMGKFPWIFGLFSGYEPDSDIRGFYHWSNERIKLAKSDPFCKGFILWPELSHGDTFMTEYAAHNAWENETISIEDFITFYCKNRYSAENRTAMEKIWQTFMPIVEMRSWNPVNLMYMQYGQDTFVQLGERAKFDPELYPCFGREPEDGAAHKDEAAKVLRALAEITPDDEMINRDIIDVARTVLGRFTDCAVRLAEVHYLEKDSRMYADMEAARNLLKTLCALYASHSDFSLLHSLRLLEKTTEINPNFEITLKRNASGLYCRSHISENATYLYLPEMEIIFGEVKKSFESGNAIDREAIDSKINENTERFFATPLEKMVLSPLNNISDALKSAADIIEKIDFSHSKIFKN